jgi:glutaredoxin 3
MSGPATIIIYSTQSCPSCIRAKQFFENRDLAYTELRVDNNEQLRQEMEARSARRRTVPQIFINDQHIGGYDDLMALARTDALDQLLREEKSNA